MTDFLMIVPTGWESLPNITPVIEQWGENNIVQACEIQNMLEISSMLENSNYSLDGRTIVEARIFNTGSTVDRLSLWVRFG